MYFVPVGLWVTAIFSGVRVSIGQLIGMRLRKIPPSVIVNSLITATKAGIPLTPSDLETHYLAGGDVPNVIKALISADKANISLTFKQATAIDLAGRNVFEAVQISVNPKVINTPKVAAVAALGVLITFGFTEICTASNTFLPARSIAVACLNVKLILALSRGLDAGTAFEILSIDIADVDVGANIGATLQTDQAAADLRVAEARAEERRAMAVAVEQEMKAKAQEARAKVIEAEAEIPKAIAQAFLSGNLGVMDYYKMQNVQSDTEMRNSISGSGKSGSSPNPTK